ncbi:MAG: hypothetical protein NC543_09290 [bacterium]|nr:hypothetical protein [bacterium]MCM1375708.1 hypothetical protein [Muribaculum sp.]
MDNKTPQSNRLIPRMLQNYPFLTVALLSMSVGIVLTPFLAEFDFSIAELPGLILGGTMITGGFVVYPWALTAAELYLAVRGHRRPEVYRKGRIFDVIGIPLGVMYSILYLGLLHSVEFGADWDSVLYNAQTHTPIYTQSSITIWVLALTGYVGYLAVNFFISLKKAPPLIPVLGIAAMYLGTVESIVWGIQVFRLPTNIEGIWDIWDIYLLLFPLNCVIVTARTVRHKIWEWEQLSRPEQETSPWLQKCNRLLMRSKRWPFAAFLLMWPLFGVLIALLLLAGQRPDAAIRAFTETSGWNLSQRVAPQNIYYDEHYLCTVAAGGHKRVVKPLRLGVRHGHEVIVNRQLCVANAFEQILEEKTPGLHKAVRHLYDTYGFPVARLIRSRYTADIIYLLMKPLEWLFLIVLYLTDVNPENRIALQYTGKSLRDFTE